MGYTTEQLEIFNCLCFAKRPIDSPDQAILEDMEDDAPPFVSLPLSEELLWGSSCAEVLSSKRESGLSPRLEIGRDEECANIYEEKPHPEHPIADGASHAITLHQLLVKQNGFGLGQNAQ